MLKFKTSCAVLANLSSNLLNEVDLFFFRYFEVGLRVCDIVVNKFTFAISFPDEFSSLKLRTSSASSVAMTNRQPHCSSKHKQNNRPTRAQPTKCYMLNACESILLLKIHRYFYTVVSDLQNHVTVLLNSQACWVCVCVCVCVCGI